MEDATPERWLPVIGYEGLYEVSDFGHVRGLDRMTRHGRRVSGRMLRLTPRKDGHLMVSLWRDDRGKNRFVHSLVAEAFMDSRPDGSEIRHEDSDLSNCRLSNLRYDFRAELFVQLDQRIGAGVVIDPEVRISGHGHHKTERAARLLCDCGKEYVQMVHRLTGSSPVLSCGCLTRQLRAANLAKVRVKGSGNGHHEARGPRNGRFIDRQGERYGKLVVISLARSDSKVRWLCRCDCGKEAIVRAECLSKGNTISCGCVGRGPKLPPGVRARKTVLKGYVQGARTRDLCWELTDDDFDRLTSLDCFYCGSPPSATAIAGSSRFVYNGIDRMDNDLGYTLNNVVPCCKTCNFAKKDMPYADFMAWIGRLAAHQWFQPELLPSRLLKGAA